jgi:DNA polymerase-4
VGTPFLHVDLDAFYASVEQLLDPALRGKPVLVGGGVVLAASYEARAFGVSAPMGIRQALARCPHAIVVSGEFGRYLEFSDQVMAICHDMTPRVEQISVDEAFLDVSGSVHLLGPPDTIGGLIRTRVREEIGLPISVGIASTKFLAKVASGQAKPDGLLHVPTGGEVEWLHGLPVSVIWGVGPVTVRALLAAGIETVGELAHTPSDLLERRIGPGAGRKLRALAWNRDPRHVVTEHRAGSLGSQSALGRGLVDDEALGRVLLAIADRVSARLRKKGRAGRTITVRVRFSDMTSATRAITLPVAVATTSAIHHTGLTLLAAARTDPLEPVTLVGVNISKLEQAAPLQLELPFDEGDPTRAGSPAGIDQLRIDEQVDRARARFGKGSVGRAAVLLDPRRQTVPDEFRRLAEKD